MSLKSIIKHMLHCVFLFSVIFLNYYFSATQGNENSDYGNITTVILVLQQCSFLLPLPIAILMFLGLVLYNTFPDGVMLRSYTKRTPFICIRTVTRGLYPDLVWENVKRNMRTCFDAGLADFVMEVITDKEIGLPPYPRLTEIVVPSGYSTKNGTLYKARALQYCLEVNPSELSDDDWIVHLDEETVMTKASVQGIINFVLDGKHKLGQGVITYANEQVVNWLTTLLDTSRVAEDLGMLKFQLRAMHRLLLSWKGSFLVVQAGVERRITFDHGPKGSVTEDVNFGMMAVAQGYTFDFIEGDMWEKSPFTLTDFIKQRSRWSKGVILITTNGKIPFRAKFLLCYATWVSLILPVATPSALLYFVCPVACGATMDFLRAFTFGLFTYMFIFGIVKSLSVTKIGYRRYALCLLSSILVLPVAKLILDSIAIASALLSRKLQYEIVDKKLPMGNQYYETV